MSEAMTKYQAYDIIYKHLTGESDFSKDELQEAISIYKQCMLIDRYSYIPGDRVMTIYKPNKTYKLTIGKYNMIDERWEYHLEGDYGTYHAFELWSGNEIEKVVDTVG